MWIAGLRGAMAYALGMESSNSIIFQNPAVGKFSGDVMLIVSIIFSIFTILGVASMLYPIMNKLGVTSSSAVPEIKKDKSEIEKELIDQIEQKKQTSSCCIRLKRKLSVFDMLYLSPLFIKDNETIKFKNRKNLRALEQSIKNAKK
jgi:hypothetical protein